MTEINNYSNKWFILFTMCIAALMVYMELTAINMVLAPVSHSMHIQLSQSQWLITAYLIPFSSLIITGGRLGDILGNKRVFVSGVIIFIIASVVGGLATQYWLLIGARFFQGLACALVWPNTTAISYKSFSKKDKGKAVGILTGMVGFAIAAGPIVGGALTSALSWRWVFFIYLPIGALILWFVLSMKIASNKLIKERIDYKGIFLLTILLCAIILGINEVEKYHLLSGIFFGIFIIFTILFILAERNHSYALVDLKLLKNRPFMFGCLARFTTNAGFYTLEFMMGIALQKSWHLSPLHAGLKFLPLTITIGILSPLAGIIVDKVGAKKPALIGVFAFFIGYLLLYITHKEITSTLLFISFIIAGIGYGLSSPSLLTKTMSSVSDESAGIASGMFYMASTIGACIGVSLAGVIIAHYEAFLPTVQAISQATLSVMLMCTIISVFSIIFCLL